MSPPSLGQLKRYPENGTSNHCCSREDVHIMVNKEDIATVLELSML